MHSKNEPSHADIYALAGKAGVDPRTAKKALVEGVDAIRGEGVRDRLTQAMKEIAHKR